MKYAELPSDARRLLTTPRLTGYGRTIYRCLDKRCGRIFMREYIPYGIGLGRGFNECFCVLVSSAARSEILYEQKAKR